MRRFVFGLARDLGCTVAELLDRISSSELSEWMAFKTIEAEDEEAERKRRPA